MLCLTQSLSKNCATGSYFYSLPHSVTVTNVAFLFVPNGLNETLRHWECGSRREARRAAGGKKKRKGKDPDAWGGWDWKHYSQISICVCLCVTEHWRGSLMACVCVYDCVYVLEMGREASGEKREMKRMSVPLRKCHTGKICRF